MGGGDLNLKKSWHPSTYANIKKVWEKEQAHKLEEQKLEQLRKEKALEKEAEEMRQLQIRAGFASKTSEKLDWMYGHSQAKTDTAAEEYLLGNKRHDLDAIQTQALVSPRMKINPFDNVLREDPLLSIKQAESQFVNDIVHKYRRIPRKAASPSRSLESTRKTPRVSKKTKRHDENIAGSTKP